MPKLINQTLKMKKYLLILFVMLGSFYITKAQQGDETKAERIEALKIAFITNKLQLTPAEAQKFWPVYKQYEAEIVNAQLNNKNAPELETEEKILNIKKKYKPPFEKVIGPQRLNTLFNAEGKGFRKLLIQQLQNRRQQGLNQMRR
jgi:hypothetical protein